MPNKANCCCSDSPPVIVACAACLAGALEEYTVTASGFDAAHDHFNGTFVVTPATFTSCQWEYTIPGQPNRTYVNLRFFSSIADVLVDVTFWQGFGSTSFGYSFYRTTLAGGNKFDCINAWPKTLNRQPGWPGPLTIQVSRP